MIPRKTLTALGFAAATALVAGSFAAGQAEAQTSGDGSNVVGLTLKQKIQIAQDRNIPISAITDGTAQRWLQEQRERDRTVRGAVRDERSQE